ncbi:hypothetical protein [Acetobacter okinawensis]|uniref:hypothetical protein n=1 Tax=Acetobacter okinawensis TaxID=1076594 RepID=UPI0039ED0C74
MSYILDTSALRELNVIEAERASSILDIQVPTIAVLEVLDDFKKNMDARTFGRQRSHILKASKFKILDDPDWYLYKNGSIPGVSNDKGEDKSIIEGFIKLISSYTWNDNENAPQSINEQIKFDWGFCEKVKELLDKDKHEYIKKIRGMWNKNPLNFHNNSERKLTNELYFSVLNSAARSQTKRKIRNNFESDFAFYVGYIAFCLIKYGKEYGKEIPIEKLGSMDGNDYIDSMMFKYISLRKNNKLVTSDGKTLASFKRISEILSCSGIRRFEILSRKNFFISTKDFRMLIHDKKL